MIFAKNPMERREMASDGQEDAKANPLDIGVNPNKTNDLPEKEEPGIDLLKWYLKIIIESEEDPRLKE
jgi:hypothetical protein